MGEHWAVIAMELLKYDDLPDHKPIQIDIRCDSQWSENYKKKVRLFIQANVMEKLLSGEYLPNPPDTTNEQTD